MASASARKRRTRAETQEVPAVQSEVGRVTRSNVATARALANQQSGPPVTQAELGLHLDLTPARISTLASEGIIPRNADGSMPLDAARLAYIRHLRMQAGRRAKAAGRTVDLNDARHRKVELEIQKETGALVPIEDVEAVLAEAMNTLRTTLSGLGASVTRDLQLRATIEAKVNDAVDHCRRTLEEAQQASWSSGEGDVEDEEAAA